MKRVIFHVAMRVSLFTSPCVFACTYRPPRTAAPCTLESRPHRRQGAFIKTTTTNSQSPRKNSSWTVWDGSSVTDIEAKDSLLGVGQLFLMPLAAASHGTYTKTWQVRHHASCNIKIVELRIFVSLDKLWLSVVTSIRRNRCDFVLSRKLELPPKQPLSNCKA